MIITHQTDESNLQPKGGDIIVQAAFWRGQSQWRAIIHDYSVHWS